MKTHFYLLTFLVTIATIESYAQEEFSLSFLDQSIKLENTLILQLDNLFSEITKGEFSNRKLLINDDPLSLSVFNEIALLELAAADSTMSINREIINYYPVGMNRYVIQVASYVSDHLQKNNLFLIWTFVAHKTKDTYLFSTPLDYYTTQWKTKIISSVTYFYKRDLNLPRAELFAHKNKIFSNKFTQQEVNIKFYMTGD